MEDLNLPTISFDSKLYTQSNILFKIILSSSEGEILGNFKNCSKSNKA